MSFRRQIYRYYRELLAVVGMVVVAAAIGGVILTKQDYNWPWENFYEIEAEFATAQAVTPGQGQQVTIAGVRVGEISKVELEGETAVVGVQIDEPYAPIYEDATMQLRPRTGLKDMAIQLDPGTPAAGEIEEGGRLPVSNTRPDVNPDEFLRALDADTRGYLQAIVDGLGEGLRGKGEALRRIFVAGQPTAEGAAVLLNALEGRRREAARLVHNLGEVAEIAGEKDEQIATTIDSASKALGALARQEDAVRESVARLPGTLEAADSALRHTTPLARALEPAARDLEPAIDDLSPALRELKPLLRESTPIFRDQVRPLVRSGIPLLTELGPAAADLEAIGPQGPPLTDDTNYITNLLLHNPEGSEEGYLYWISWFAHNANSMLSTQDAHGAAWRGLVMFSCASAQQTQSFLPPEITLPDLPAELGC